MSRLLCLALLLLPACRALPAYPGRPLSEERQRARKMVETVEYLNALLLEPIALGGVGEAFCSLATGIDDTVLEPLDQLRTIYGERFTLRLTVRSSSDLSEVLVLIDIRF